jgi:hypothetical protein
MQSSGEGGSTYQFWLTRHKSPSPLQPIPTYPNAVCVHCVCVCVCVVCVCVGAGWKGGAPADPLPEGRGGAGLGTALTFPGCPGDGARQRAALGLD